MLALVGRRLTPPKRALVPDEQRSVHRWVKRARANTLACLTSAGWSAWALYCYLGRSFTLCMSCNSFERAWYLSVLTWRHLSNTGCLRYPLLSSAPISFAPQRRKLLLFSPVWSTSFSITQQYSCIFFGTLVCCIFDEIGDHRTKVTVNRCFVLWRRWDVNAFINDALRALTSCLLRDPAGAARRIATGLTCAPW